MHVQQMRFLPYDELDGVPNVIVDGAPTPSTRLTLSHWPGSPTPVDLRDDLSAQIALRSLDQPWLFDDLDAVSNNHFDQDGLASAFVLLHPAAASARSHRLVDVARAGDFATFVDRNSIRIAFAIAAMADPARSPLDPAVLDGSYEQQTAHLYQALIPRFAELLDRPSATRTLWEREDAHLTESLLAIGDGAVTLREHPDIDLAVVTVPGSWSDRMTSRFTINRTEALHPAAVNQSTQCFRVATVHADSYRVELRYETWVMLRSRPVQLRPDLRLLAAELHEIDDAAGWRADGPGALTPVLRHTGRSSLRPDQFIDRVTDFLRVAAPAWDPYAAA